MHKYCYSFCTIALVCALLTGCGAAPSNPPNPSFSDQTQAVTDDTSDQTQAVTDDSSDQTQAAADDTSSQEPETADNVSNTSTSSQEDDFPDAYVYTTEDHIIPMSQSVTVDGITYQVLDCEVTSEFGNRKLENLSSYEDGRTDDKGNLAQDRCYVFLTIQFTNTTNSEVEILRNDRGIFFMDEHFIIDDYTIDAVYIDEYWHGGTAGEIYHYKLAPGESITSEIGWIVSAEAIKNHDHIYYSMRFADCMTEFGGSTDPDAIFIELQY